MVSDPDSSLDTQKKLGGKKRIGEANSWSLTNML